MRVITGNGIGIRFRWNINNAKVPMIVYLKSFILSIAILRGNLGKSEPDDDEEEIVSESESEYDLTEQEVERELEIELEFI